MLNGGASVMWLLAWVGLWATGLWTTAGAQKHPDMASALSEHAAHSLDAMGLCREWTVHRDPGHPERPGYYEEESGPCARPPIAPARKPLDMRPLLVHAGGKMVLRFTTGTAGIDLLATALEDGAAGDVIRCRSTLGGAVLWGRLHAAGPAELLVGEPVGSSSDDNNNRTRGGW